MKHVMTALTVALCLFSAAPAQAQDITTGLQYHLEYESKTGNQTTDSSPNNYATTIQSEATVPVVAGPIGNAFDFSSPVAFEQTYTGAVSVNITTALTYAAWVMPQIHGNHMTVINRGDELRIWADLGQICFRPQPGSTTCVSYTFENMKWVHVAVTFNDTTDTVIFYVNGAEIGRNSAFTPAMYTASAVIRTSQAAFNLGRMDDARIYNRELTEADIRALYDLAPCPGGPNGAGVVGEIIFNRDYRAMEYCDGTNWISMGKEASVLHGQKIIGGGYQPSAVEFDGTGDYLGTGVFTNTNIATQISGSFWVRSRQIGSVDQDVIGGQHNTSPSVSLMSDGRVRIRVRGQPATPSYYIDCNSPSGVIQNNKWHHVAFSFDPTDDSKKHIYLDGVSQTPVADCLSNPPGGLLQINDGFWFGRNGAGTTYDYDIADLWIDFGTYIDLSDPTERAKFFNGGPVDLGADGSLPTGSAPEIFLSGGVDDWHTNKGTDGGFTENGALTASTTNPPATAEKKMIGWYRMDATSGTTEPDYSPIGNIGTYNNGVDPATESETGISGTAINFANDTSGRLDIANSAYTDLREATISAWVKADGTYDGVMGIVDIGALFRLRSGFNDSSIRFSTSSWTGQGGWAVNTASLVPDTWQHIAVSYSYNDPVGTAPKVYVNGILQGGFFSTTPTGTFVPNTNAFSVIAGRSDSSGSNFHGLIDDVRIYNYVLSADEIAEIYAASDMAYQPNAVNFDGANDSLEVNAPLTGVTASKQWTGSFWVKSGNNARLHRLLSQSDSVAGSSAIILWRQDGSDRIDIQALNAAGTQILRIQTDPITDTDWHHVMFSVDLSDPAKRHIYVDDVSGIQVDTYLDDLIVAADTRTRVLAGGGSSGGVDKLLGDAADFWMDFGTYIDLSVEENRRKFISAAGEAVFLGNNGELVTGDPPDIFLSGDTDSWHTNKGAGGGFTENGALTDAATEPPGGASIIPRYCTNPVQPAATLIYNSSENVMQYCDGYRYIPLSAPGLGAGGCVSPSGLAGEMVFNTSVNSLQYCDGSGWVGVGDAKPNPDPCAGSPSIGDECDDGTIYAGLSPDGNVAMYTTPSDASTTFAWNNANSAGRTNTSITDATVALPALLDEYVKGYDNTIILITEDSNSSVAGVQPHRAARYCYCLGKPLTGVCSSDPTGGADSYGHDDWYLPAAMELYTLYENLVDQNGDDTPNGPLGSTFNFNTSGSFPAGFYLGSSESTAFSGFRMRFDTGFYGYGNKNEAAKVRCVRKG